MTNEPLDILGDLRHLAEQWKAETNGDFGLRLDIEAQVRDLVNYSNNPQMATVLFLVRENHVVGYMGLVIFKSPLSEQRIAEEHYWYILPEFRRLKLSNWMFNEAKKWARDKGCSHLIMNASNLAGKLHDKVCRLYERYGMKKFETVFISEV